MSTCSWIWYLVYMICNIWTCWHDMIHVSNRDNHVNIVLFHVWMIGIMLTQLSCTRSCLQILYRGWSYREYMMDIMETWLMSTISSIHILYHADGTLNLSHVTHIMHTWYRDIMCRYEDISCVMCRYEGRAELCACVRTTQLAAHVIVYSNLQGHNLMSHDHIFGSESHTNGEIMSQWETCCWYTCTFGLGLRHKFPFTVTGLSYQDPISLFRFIKFIKTKFQRTPRLCRV